MQLYLFNLFNNEISSFYTLNSLSQAVDESLLMNLIKNAHLMTVAASLTSQNIILRM